MPSRSTGPREMPEATYQWLKRTHALFAGLEHLERHWGGPATTTRWVIEHGYSAEAAEAEALDVLERFIQR